MCGQPCPAHDFTEKRWRHLNFFQHHCYITAAVPRVQCPEHGVRLVDVPWARKGSAFTLLFEQAALALVREMPVLAAGTYDQGFATVEFVSSAMVDLEFHTGQPPACGSAIAPAVSIGIDGATAVLEWQHVAPNTQYQVWRSTDPYFMPGCDLPYATVPAAGLEVDIDELKKAGRIEFINYTGPKRNQDSVAAVKSIGSGLAVDAQNRGDNARVSYYMKYSLIRAISKEEPEKFSADIFS